MYHRDADASAFRNVPAHDFYAAQWSPSKTSQSNFRVEKDYWFNSQGKPCVNYEGQYCYLWTKNYGARMQGWTAFLNGFCGAAWGGHDTWSYLNIYDEENDSSDGVDTVTSAEKKAATWRDALAYPSAAQFGYMRDFLERTQWFDYVPRFDNRAYFVPCRGVYYACAGTPDNREITLYFYAFSDPSVAEKPNARRYGGTQTGTVGSLIPNGAYVMQWFDSVHGTYSAETPFRASRFGTCFPGEKPSASDWVLWIRNV